MKTSLAELRGGHLTARAPRAAVLVRAASAHHRAQRQPATSAQALTRLVTAPVAVAAFGSAAAPALPPRRRAAGHVARAATAAASGEGDEQLILGTPLKTWKKVVPLGAMFFCILFNYTILRDTKDVLVVTAPGSGAEVIPFLKTWVNLPAAIGFTVLYTKLSSVLEPEALFYTVIFPFIAFFATFAFVLYPAQGLLHPHAWADGLLAAGGARFAGPIAIARNWTYALFYVMAELWGSVVVSVLFWGFANQITETKEAKQFYPLFGLGANVALVVSGQTVKYFSRLRAGLPDGVDGWGVSLRGMMSLVAAMGCLIAGIYWRMNRTIVADLVAERGEALKASTKKKKKAAMGVGESFVFLAKSAYVRALATLVVCYGVAINLVEVTWKSKLKAQYPNPNEYSEFMGNFSSWTGIVTFALMLASRVIFARYGWGAAALVTPTVLLVTAVAFFSLVLFGSVFDPITTAFGLTPLAAAVLIGAAQNIFSKGSKYALFDPCKEMAYIPLDQDTKTKGKAAIDVICNPLGKSGGSAIQQLAILTFGSLAASTPYLAAVLFFVVAAWIMAARDLNTRFTELEMADVRAKLAAAGRTSADKAGSSKIEAVVTEDGFIEGDVRAFSEVESTDEGDDGKATVIIEGKP